MIVQSQIPVAFKDLRRPARYKSFYGGRGGGKSWAFAETLIIKSIESKIRVLCAREIQRSIRDSVKRVLEDCIKRMGIEKVFRMTNYNIECKSSGSEFIFAGLKSNPDTIKSLEGIDIVWGEEAHRFSQQSLDILIPTIRRPGSELWFSWNPKYKTDPIYKMFFDGSHPGSIVKKVNFDSNPFFPQVLKDEMDFCKAKDPDKFNHVWMGMPVHHSEAQIFYGQWVSEEFDPPPAGTQLYYGGDFGFAKDPSTLVRCYIVGNDLFIDHEAYAHGVEIDALPELYKKVPGAYDNTVVCDSSRPDTISYLRRNGIHATGSTKGPGSIEDGLAFLKSFNIKVHPRCKHVIDELMTYSFEIDKHTGLITDKIKDSCNHCMDALRYATERVRKAGRVYVA